MIIADQRAVTLFREDLLPLNCTQILQTPLPDSTSFSWPQRHPEGWKPHLSVLSLRGMKGRGGSFRPTAAVPGEGKQKWLPTVCQVNEAAAGVIQAAKWYLNTFQNHLAEALVRVPQSSESIHSEGARGCDREAMNWTWAATFLANV